MEKFLLITTELIGSGDDGLGKILMRSFMTTLSQGEEIPEAIGLVNGGVKLACSGSEVLGDLALLASRGVVVRACSTCLDFYDLKSSLVVGEPGTMPSTVASLMSAGDVIVIS